MLYLVGENLDKDRAYYLAETGRIVQLMRGIYAGVLQALGLLEGLGQVADISNDSVGQALASADLPKHVHLKRPTRSSQDG